LLPTAPFSTACERPLARKRARGKDLQELALEVAHLLEGLDAKEILAREIHLLDATPFVKLPVGVENCDVVLGEGAGAECVCARAREKERARARERCIGSGL